LLDGMRPVFIGLCIGLAGGAGAGALVRSVLYGTRALDPLVYAVMIACLLVTAVAACAVPALQASRIEPMRALRTE
jgi:ABC-type antimicrobial peptide transport system permease subunit